MNFCYRISLSLLLLCSVVFSSTIESAYQHYLAASYSKSLDIYLACYTEDATNRDALYGIVNCHAALLQYDKALAWCDTLLQRESDPLMVEKKMWLFGLTNKSRKAGSLWKKKDTESFTKERKRAIAMSCGWGFYAVGNHKTAEVWFNKASELQSGIDVEQALLLNSQKKQDIQATGSVSLYGGPILYSGQTLTDAKGDKYSYKSGTYFGGEATLTFNERHSLTLMASRFDAKLSEQKYYFEGDTLLSWDTVYTGTKLYGIEVDTLYRSLDDQFVGGKYNLQNKIDSLQGIGFTLDTAIGYDLNGFADTAFYFFKVDSLGELDSINTDELNYEKYDSVDWKDTVEWDSTLSWKDTVTVQPDPLWQNTIYVGYTGTKIGGKNVTLGSGLQLFNSNMSGMKKGLVLWAMHKHSTKWFDVAGNYYFTALDTRKVTQVSVQGVRQWGKFILQLEPTMTFSLANDSGYAVPTFQKSLSLDLSYYLKRVTLTENIVIGERQFTAESMGMNLVTVTAKHQLTSVSKIVARPFKKETISLFGILRFEKYNSFDRKIVLGGVTVAW